MFHTANYQCQTPEIYDKSAHATIGDTFSKGILLSLGLLTDHVAYQPKNGS